MRASNSSSVASPQASVSSSAAASWSAAAIPQGPSSVLDRNASRPCERASRIGSRAGSKPPQPASLTFDHVAGPSSTARRTSSGVGHRLVGGDRRGHALAHLGQLLQRARRAARRARGRAASSARIARTASSTDQAALASSRSAGQGPTASRTAATRSASSGRPDLDLEAGVALAQALAGPRRHLLGRAGAAASGSPPARPCAARPAGAPPARASRSSRAISSAARACGGPRGRRRR